MTNALRIAVDLRIPSEAVTQTFAILAKRGSGKTYTALVMAEEMLRAKLQVVIVDPIGVTWGLRAAADGKGPGLPIGVLGGEHADLPLESGAGEVIADLVVDEGVSLVLDLSRFRKGEQGRFMQAFAERLYHRNRQPLHLFLDEADAFAPQRPAPGEQRLLGAIEDLVRRGRARGIGVTLITQRAAVLNKNVLTQAEVLVALRTIAPQDRKAMEAWIEVHGSPKQQEELLASLASLELGEAWFWSPGWLDVFKRVRVRQRETFDSSATPRAGARPREPKRLAQVDLAALERRMKDTVERAKASDPKHIRARVAELEAKLQKTHSAAPAKTETLKVPVLKEGQLKRLETLSERLAKLGGQITDFGLELTAALRNSHARMLPFVPPAAFRQPGRQRPPAVPRAHGGAAPAKGLGAERKVLAVLAARAPAQLSRSQIGTLAGLSWRGGTFNTYLSRLRTAGYVTEAGELLSVTPEGLAAFGECPPAPASPKTVQAQWKRALGEHAAGRLIDVLVSCYPALLRRDELASQAGLTANAGTFNTYLSRLRSNALIEEYGDAVTASATLMGET